LRRFQKSERACITQSWNYRKKKEEEEEEEEEEDEKKKKKKRRLFGLETDDPQVSTYTDQFKYETAVKQEKETLSFITRVGFEPQIQFFKRYKILRLFDKIIGFI
jgi:hypothetical protein